MDVMSAARTLVRRFRGGVSAMALMLGKSDGTLRNELSGKHDFAKLGLMDAVAMMDESADPAILEAWAAHAGYMVLPLPTVHMDKDHPVLQTMARVSEEFADLCTVVCQALADGNVSDNELKRVTKEAGELIAQINVLYGDLSRANLATKAKGTSRTNPQNRMARR